MQQHPQRGTKRSYAALTIPTNWGYEGKIMTVKVTCMNCRSPLFYKESPRLPGLPVHNMRGTNKRSTENGMCLDCEENSSSQKYWWACTPREDASGNPKTINSCTICDKRIYEEHTLAYLKCGGCVAKPENIREIMIMQKPAAKLVALEWTPPRRICHYCHRKHNIFGANEWNCNECAISRSSVDCLDKNLRSIFFLIWCTHSSNNTWKEENQEENNHLTLLPRELVHYIIFLQILDTHYMEHISSAYDRFFRDIPIPHWKYLYRCIPPSLLLLK